MQYISKVQIQKKYIMNIIQKMKVIITHKDKISNNLVKVINIVIY